MSLLTFWYGEANSMGSPNIQTPGLIESYLGNHPGYQELVSTGYTIGDMMEDLMGAWPRPNTPDDQQIWPPWLGLKTLTVPRSGGHYQGLKMFAYPTSREKNDCFGMWALSGFTGSLDKVIEAYPATAPLHFAATDQKTVALARSWTNSGFLGYVTFNSFFGVPIDTSLKSDKGVEGMQRWGLKLINMQEACQGGTADARTNIGLLRKATTPKADGAVSPYVQGDADDERSLTLKDPTTGYCVLDLSLAGMGELAKPPTRYIA